MVAHKYFLEDGTRVPGVTTILGTSNDPGGLVHWAWQEGMAGRNYRDTSSRLATAGSIAHELVERYIRQQGKRPTRVRDIERMYECDKETAQRAFQAFGNFLKWVKDKDLSTAHPELSLVSETHKFGGTMDAVNIGNKLAILDWKTGKGLYPEYLVQVAAYGILFKENYEYMKDGITGGYDIVRFIRDEGDFHHHHFDELKDAEEQFLLLRAAYETNKRLKKRC